MIRQANTGDISRISEILVFTKRVNYRRIFHNDEYSFGELQVLSVARELEAYPERLTEIWVFEERFVKGLIRIREREVAELYVDSFFSGQGIGGKLLDFAVDRFDVRNLWVLEENPRAIAFYERHGFRNSGIRKYEKEPHSGYFGWNDKTAGIPTMSAVSCSAFGV